MWLATLAVTVATVGLQWFRIRDTFWAIDDLILLGIAHEQPFGLPLLRKAIFEHFSPLLWTENKLEVGPLHANHGVALAIGLGIAAVGIASMHRLVLRLTRSPAWALTLSGLYGSSLFLTTILRWWTTSVHANLAATLSIACLLAFCRFEEERHIRDAVASAVLLGAALLTHEKALLVPLYLGLLWLFVYQRAFSPGAIWAALRRELWLWICYAVLEGASLANFLAYYYQPRAGPPLKALAAFMLRSVFTTFLPVSIGVRLPGYGYPGVGGSIGGAIQALAVAGFLIAVVITCRVTRGAVRGWLFLAIAFTANLWVLGTAVLPAFPSGAYHSLQWQLELAFLLPIGVAILVREIRSRSGRAGTSSRPRSVAVALLAALLLPYLWLSAVSNREVRGEFNGGTYSRPFLANLRWDLATPRGAGATPTLLDRPLPGTFAPAWMFPYNMLREFLPTFGVPATTGGHAAGAPVYVVGENGTIHAYQLGSVVRPTLLLLPGGQAAQGVSACTSLGPGAAQFEATFPATFPAGALGTAPVLRVDYKSDRPVHVDVTSAGRGTPAELSYGQLSMNAADTEYDLLLRGPLSNNQMNLVVTGNPGGSFCLDGLALGEPTESSGP